MKSTIRYPAPPGWGEVAASFSDESAGAVQSLTWLGKEFLNANDHGRLLQSAVSFDGKGEAFNPTEAGCEADGRMSGPSTSRLRCLTASASSVKTVAQMALWRAVGAQRRSNVTLTKRLTLGYRGVWNAIEHEVTFELPEDASYASGVFETLTGYMPAEFSRFETLDPKPLSDGPGEQPSPVMFSTPDGAWAMGVYSPAAPSGYGRWRNPDGAMDTNKWNVVTRIPNPRGVYTFRHILAIGNRGDVLRTLTGLAALEA